MRGTVIVHNPFTQAKGRLVEKKRTFARFEIRARLRNEIDEIDAQIIDAARNQRPYLVDSLAKARARLVQRIDDLSGPKRS